jgi:hypothetical protein
VTSLASPAAEWPTVNRSVAAPASSIMQTACSDQDQSTPAHRIGPSASSVVLLLVTAASR